MKPKQQRGLFGNDPALKFRDSKGRFATAERAYADKAIEENKLLRHECEKYRRSYLAAAKLASYWQRKFLELQEEANKSKNQDKRRS